MFKTVHIFYLDNVIKSTKIFSIIYGRLFHIFIRYPLFLKEIDYLISIKSDVTKTNQNHMTIVQA